MSEQKPTRGPRKAKGDTERKRLLDAFELVTENELATLFNVDIRTLRNRPQSELPRFTKTGAQRLFFRQDVLEYMQQRMSRP